MNAVGAMTFPDAPARANARPWFLYLRAQGAKEKAAETGGQFMRANAGTYFSFSGTTPPFSIICFMTSL
jgi:hypothetical protein